MDNSHKTITVMDHFIGLAVKLTVRLLRFERNSSFQLIIEIDSVLTSFYQTVQSCIPFSGDSDNFFVELLNSSSFISILLFLQQ